MSADADIAEGVLVVRAMARLFLPVVMTVAEAELVGEPPADEAVLFSFMGSGASDMVTFGQFRKAMSDASAWCRRMEGDDEPRIE